LALEVEGKAKAKDNIVSPTGIEDEALAKALKIFPNPTTQNISLEFSNKTFGGIHIAIIDLTGRVVLEKSYSKVGKSFSVKFQIKNGGLYLVHVKGKNSSAVKKIVVH